MQQGSSTVQPTKFSAVENLLPYELSSMKVQPVVNTLVVSYGSLTSSAQITVESQVDTTGAPEVDPTAEPATECGTAFKRLKTANSTTHYAARDFANSSLPRTCDSFSAALLESSTALLTVSRTYFTSPISTIVFAGTISIKFIAID